MSVANIRSRWQSGSLEFYDVVSGDVLIALRSNSGEAYVDLPVGTAYGGAGSWQRLMVDAKFAAGAGSSVAFDTNYLAAFMGNALADVALTDTRNMVAGVIGKYTIQTNAGLLGKAGVIGEAAMPSADAAVLGVISDGEGVAATPNAVFGVKYLTGSQTGSKAAYGLDLYGAAFGEFNAVSFGTADIRMQNGMVIKNDKTDRTMIGARIGVCDDASPADNAPTNGVVLYFDGTDLKAKNSAGLTATLNNAAFA